MTFVIGFLAIGTVAIIMGFNSLKRISTSFDLKNKKLLDYLKTNNPNLIGGSSNSSKLKTIDFYQK